MKNGIEGGTGMDLVERYLNAVAAQLPKEARDDIVAGARAVAAPAKSSGAK